jgi:multicomponent Na+:H+ antiporter subunit F
MMLLDIALVVLAVTFGLALLRAVIGPSVADRAVAADVALYVVVAAVALLALRSQTGEFIDVVLIATLLGFLATVALGMLVGRRGS